MALPQNYYQLWFESFVLDRVSGHKSRVQLKLSENQKIPEEIEGECETRGINPYEMVLECNRKLFTYPIGTRFYINAKLTDRDSGGMYFYTYYRWKPIEIIQPS
jgi:hypothetical protein